MATVMLQAFWNHRTCPFLWEFEIDGSYVMMA